jgi:hypothetical protein
MGGSVRLWRGCLGWRLVRFEAMEWYSHVRSVATVLYNEKQSPVLIQRCEMVFIATPCPLAAT